LDQAKRERDIFARRLDDERAINHDLRSRLEAEQALTARLALRLKINLPPAS
jgi:hypothetical protein